jgi:hypothetical protein
MSQTVLNSWKEIARYLDRGVRTVQRWERDLKLPVHRPRGRTRSAVMAVPEELDAWVRLTWTRTATPVGEGGAAVQRRTLERLANQMAKLQQRAKQLVSGGSALRQEMEAARQFRERARSSRREPQTE